MKKTCKKCGEFKEHRAFGLCYNCYSKRWSAENPEKIKKIQKKSSRKYYIKHLEKEKARGKKYCAENIEKVKARYKKYRTENPEKVRKASDKWAKEHPEKVKEYKKKSAINFRINHPERVREFNKKWREKYPERVKELDRKKTKKYRINHPERIREYKLKRRVNGTIKSGIIKQIINENILHYGIITCEKCEKECETHFHVDHIIPVSKGGNNNYNNLQILCAKCNQEKATKIADYRQDIEGNQLFLREAI